ncbi:MAG: cobalt ECF transporter T component CbiQ [Candidatus Nanopelagicales bacterium]
MGAGHQHGHDVGEALYVHRHTTIHLLAPEVKIVALVLFMFVVVATPAEQFWAFGLYAAMLIGIAAIAGLNARIVAPRMLVEIPFVLFAVLMPFFGPDPSVRVLGVWLSVAGLWAAWGILAKATLGVLAAVILAASTRSRDIIAGLAALRLPAVMVSITMFMLRYMHVVADEMHRMGVARESRGFQATGVRSWPVLGQSAGALFIRSYERGERVHLAMLSRGYTGTMPVLDAPVTSRSQWLLGLTLPGLALIVCLIAWATR